MEERTGQNVFISYRRSDLDKVEKIVEELAQKNYRVWLDERSIEVGDSVIDKIADALRGAEYMLVCFSESSNSPWMDREWMSALARQLDGEKIKILPIILGGTIPRILADIKYADLRLDWRRGMESIFKALGRL